MGLRVSMFTFSRVGCAPFRYAPYLGCIPRSVDEAILSNAFVVKWTKTSMISLDARLDLLLGLHRP